jgi:hypothetical protein
VPTKSAGIFANIPSIFGGADNQRIRLLFRRGAQCGFYHQMLGACIVHPDMPNVIPFCPEPILGY